MTGRYEIATADLQLIHPIAIEDPRKVRAFLERLRRDQISLQRGMNKKVLPERARLVQVDRERLVFRTSNFHATGRSQIFFNAEMAGRRYFFACRLLGREDADPLEVGIPAVIWLTDRRDRGRQTIGRTESELRAELRVGANHFPAQIADCSPGGLGLWVEAPASVQEKTPVRVRFLDGRRAGQSSLGIVRNAPPTTGPHGWRRVGLSLLPAPVSNQVEIERPRSLSPASPRRRAWAHLEVLRAGAFVASERLVRRLLPLTPRESTPEIIEYRNADGETLRAVVDSWGETRGAVAVIIPPAWGRTKETLLPLARTIVATFRAAGQPIVVVRFDGVRKRGESHRDPDCLLPGEEHKRFTFYQGVRDIEATLDFLGSTPRFRPSASVLVTFSAAAIEGRRLVADDGGRRLRGWISVVGAPDIQSMMRVISGGVDYVRGAEEGVRFGLQEILGVVVDIDHAARDAFRHRMSYIEDSRQDMARIRVPVTWLHGRDDAWMDLARVQDVLSVGPSAGRRLIEIPTGHMLKSSREALEVFQLIASEAARMAMGRKVMPALPDLVDLNARQQAERSRLRRRGAADVRAFWTSYLLGRSRQLGIELMNETSNYRRFMDSQIRSLSLRPGELVADLGAGAGPFPVALARAGVSATVDAYDYVAEALQRAERSLQLREGPPGLVLRSVVADLSITQQRRLPVRDQTYHAILASLLLSYIANPRELLREAFRALKPGGRLVVSSMKPDADPSKLYVEGLTELRAGLAQEVFGPGIDRDLDRLSQSFLNDAARLFDLEEEGLFQFWEADEIEDMLRQAGFTDIRSERTFGDPPQAYVLAASRPSGR